MLQITHLCLFAILVGCMCSWPLSSEYAQFKAYAQEYNKRYDSYGIELYRFAIYLKNLVEIEELNLMEEGSAVYG